MKFLELFMKFKLISLFEMFGNTQAHEVVADLDWDGPLRVVDIRKMAVLFCNFLSLLQDFLVVKLGVVSAFEVEHPALYLFALGVNADQLLQLVYHPEVLSPEGPFDRQYSMAKSSDLSTFLMDFFHDGGDNPQGIDLRKDRIDFDEADTLTY